MVINGISLHLRASFGGAFGTAGVNAEEVLAQADAAMYAVKRQHDRRDVVNVITVR